MRRWLLCILGLIGSTSTLASELAGLDSDGDKALYCFQAHILRMQIGGAALTDPNLASTLIKNGERWGTVIQRLLPDPMAQQSARQNATTRLTERMRAVGRDRNAMLNQVVEPLGAECDALLEQLDKPAAAAQPSTAAAATPAATSSQPVATGPYDKDVFAGLVQSSRYADFRWNPHSDIYAKIKGRGEFRRIRNGFRLEFETRIKTLCVGDLIESRRSEDGYLMHLTVPDGSGEGCQPRVTRGVLFPMAFDETREYRRLMLRLYDDQNRLVTSLRFESKALQAKHLDPEKLMVMDEIVYAMEQGDDDRRRAAKLVNLQNDPDFPRLKPFYDSCLARQSAPLGSTNPSYYCICMTYKFGVGERIPESEFQSYVQDFTLLTDQLRVHTDDNKLYTRLDRECGYCSNPERTLRAGCDTPDNAMLLPSTFAGVIDQMEKKELRLESSEFYKENFFVIYLQGYSDYCTDQIVEPIPFDYVVTETTTDQYGFSYSDEVQRDRTYVAREHSDRYQAIYDKHAKMSPEQFFSAIRQVAVSSESDLRRLQSDVAMRIEIETEKRVAVREHLAQGCNSTPVQRTYSRLSELFE